MPRRKSQYIPKAFESRGLKFEDSNGTKRTDTSANIYESMLLSTAFKKLSNRQKMLYVLCKTQYYGHRKPSKDYEELGLFQSDDHFYMNFANIESYGLYTKTMRKEFYGDLAKLEEHGFIKKVSTGGGAGHTKSVFQFSSEWQSKTALDFPEKKPQQKESGR